MTKVREVNGSLTVSAYRGDAETLLAFDITEPVDRERLAGFTIQVKPDGKPAYYYINMQVPERNCDQVSDLRPEG